MTLELPRSPGLRPANVGSTVARRSYELFDGTLVVRPAPMAEHQRAVARLVQALQRHCPRTLEVLPGPIAFQPTNWRSFAPDVVVLCRSSAQPTGPQTTPPVLIAEVIDRRSRTLDRHLKPQMYASCGVDHYWLFDPAVPEFIAYRRLGQRYTEVVTVAGDERVGFKKPILAEICPAQLVAT